MFKFFIKAASVANANADFDKRKYLLGCLGIRQDGKEVLAQNGMVDQTYLKPEKLIYSHAEGRVIRKLGKNGTLFVVRVSKKNKTIYFGRAM